jgi:endoglucanase
MKMKLKFLYVFLILVFFACSDNDSATGPDGNNADTIVKKFGQLSIEGVNIVDKNNQVVQLSGMSLFWSQWAPQYYNYETIKWLRDNWKCTLVRAAMGIESGGYLDNPDTEYRNVKFVVDACIELGIYVIVDWHDHHGENHLQEAIQFFDRISKEYGDHPNVIYEIYNEPLDVSWKDVLKPHQESIINIIRQNDPDNLIIAGTPNWSQDVEAVIGNEIDDQNVAYSLHFYTGTHGQWLRDKANLAITAGLPLFVSEWGLSEADGAGSIDYTETSKWQAYLEANNLSWCNWSVTNKDETSAAIRPTVPAVFGWDENDLSESGQFIRNYLITENGPIFNSLDN